MFSRRFAGPAAVAVVAGALVLALAALVGDGAGPPAPDAALVASPTPWSDEELQALAAAQGPPPATCEPPEMQDLRLVDASELLAQGLQPAGRLIVSGHCPLYVANRVDRAVVWAGGGSVLHIDRQADRRLMSADGCCASLLLTIGGTGYQLSGSGWSTMGWSRRPFSVIDSELASIERTGRDGAYVTFNLRETTPIPGQIRHRMAFASDGQMFIDARPLPGELVYNQLTGEEIDVSSMGPGIPPRARVSTESVRTDCWEEDGVCRVYLDGVGGVRDGEIGMFNPPTMLAPFDGTLSCVEDEGGWSIDGPALAYEVSNGPLNLRIGAFGGAWEAWEDCRPRLVQRGMELEVWTYTYIEATYQGEPVSIVASRDGHLYVGDADLELGCPCEVRR